MVKIKMDNRQDRLTYEKKNLIPEGVPGAEKLNELIERGRKKGRLTATEMMELEGIDLDGDILDRFYEICENCNIDLVADEDITDSPDMNEELTEEGFASYLDSAGVCDPDLLIRPGGEQRLSNFLLWQCAYAEFYFTDVLWPDFSPAELDKALEVYRSRDRRFGKVKTP